MRTFFLAIVFIAGSAFGEGPATRSTQPATQPASPREVNNTIANALWKGVPQDISSNCVARSAGTKRMVKDMADFAVALAAIHKANRTKFGNEGLLETSPMMQSPPDIDKTTESINGDHAVVHLEDGKAAPFVKLDGAWKFDLDAELQDVKTSTTEVHHLFSSVTRAMNQTTANIVAGKYATLDEMHDALDEAEAQAMQSPPAATAPSAN